MIVGDAARDDMRWRQADCRTSIFFGVAMHTVQIEHPIRDFNGWKAAFDRDPARREASGVKEP